jgi:hypothetical protein
MRRQSRVLVFRAVHPAEGRKPFLRQMQQGQGMSDLPASTWREIEKASIYLPAQNSQNGQNVGRYIGVGTLKTILRKSRRTNDQNALLWSLYEDILRKGGEALGGWTKDDLHEYVLGEFWGWDKHEAFGRARLKPKKRSSRLTKLEFSDLLEFIVRRMAEHGIVLQLPGDLREAG